MVHINEPAFIVFIIALVAAAAAAVEADDDANGVEIGTTLIDQNRFSWTLVLGQPFQ